MIRRPILRAEAANSTRPSSIDALGPLRRWLLLVFLLAILAGATALAFGGQIYATRVTYAPNAKAPHKATDPALPKGTQPCAAYPESGDGVLRYSKAMSPPQRTAYRRSDYSTLNGKDLRSGGILFAEVIVGSDGQVSSINVLKSVSPELDALFIEEMKSSRYRPAELAGRRVPVCMIYTARPHFR